MFAAIILLDPSENSYCVPLERSSSLLAGLVAAYHPALGAGACRNPTGMELLGAALLFGAILLLTIAPKLERR